MGQAVGQIGQRVLGAEPLATAEDERGQWFANRSRRPRGDMLERFLGTDRAAAQRVAQVLEPFGDALDSQAFLDSALVAQQAAPDRSQRCGDRGKEWPLG